jgi:hypothetical protein
VGVGVFQGVDHPRGRGDLVNHPQRRGVRRNRPEQPGLITHRTQIGQAVAGVGDHHREVPDHAAGVVAAATLAQLTRRRLGETDLVDQAREQAAASM